MRTFLKKFKNSIWGKILKVLFNILKWALEITIITIALIILTQRLTNSEKSFLGFRIFDVASGSMEPDYAVGDILIVREKEPSKIVLGENIVYLGTKSDYKGRIITHRVIEIERDEKGDYLFHTKGIANTVEDPVVHEDQVYGVVIQNNIVLAKLCKILTNRYGLYFFVIIPIILYAFVEFVKIQGKKIEEERAEEAREREAEKKKEEEREKVIKEKEKRQEDEEKQNDEVNSKIEKDREMLEQNKEKLKKLKQEKEELDKVNKKSAKSAKAEEKLADE